MIRRHQKDNDGRYIVRRQQYCSEYIAEIQIKTAYFPTAPFACFFLANKQWSFLLIITKVYGCRKDKLNLAHNNFTFNGSICFFFFIKIMQQKVPQYFTRHFFQGLFFCLQVKELCSQIATSTPLHYISVKLEHK